MRSFQILSLVLLCVGGVWGQTSSPNQEASYLHEPAYCLDRVLRGPARAYLPQPGDIMLATDDNKFWKVTHDLALAFEPHNSAMVVARPDGSLVILEAGPNDTLWVRVLDMLPHLREYEDKGEVWIRKRKAPLTAEQNKALTDFAMNQEWKRFALIRLGAQLTPLRSRGPVRTHWLGKARPERCSFYCSELVVTAGVVAGVMDELTARPSATYPHDLLFDHSHNCYLQRHFNLSCGWDPPARWVSCPSN